MFSLGMTSPVGSDAESLRAEARYLSFLVRAGELIGESIDYHQTLKNVCEAAVTSVADICLLDLGGLGVTEQVAAAHRDPSRTRELFDAGAYLKSAPGRPPHPVLQVIDSGRPLVAEHVDEAWLESHATSDGHAAFMRAMEYDSMIVAPVVSVLYGITGALTLVTTKHGRRRLYAAEAVFFAEDLGRRCGMAIGKARLYQRTLAVAQRFQLAALPRTLPDLPGVQFSALYEPAHTTMMVGGDWYDVFLLPDGRIGISVGDVSGHGLEAAVTMSSIKNTLQAALVVEPDLSRALGTGDFVLRSENRLRVPDEGQFCTAMIGILDPAERTLQTAPAGHPGPKIWDPLSGEVVDPFPDRDLPLGYRDLSKPCAKTRTMTLERGAFVVFYTDGLVEAERDFLAGERELEAAIARRDVRESDDPAFAIRRTVAPQAPYDDLAILTIRLR
jgi:hypothetical protein